MTLSNQDAVGEGDEDIFIIFLTCNTKWSEISQNYRVISVCDSIYTDLYFNAEKNDFETNVDKFQLYDLMRDCQTFHDMKPALEEVRRLLETYPESKIVSINCSENFQELNGWTK